MVVTKAVRSEGSHITSTRPMPAHEALRAVEKALGEGWGVEVVDLENKRTISFADLRKAADAQEI